MAQIKVTVSEEEKAFYEKRAKTQNTTVSKYIKSILDMPLDNILNPEISHGIDMDDKAKMQVYIPRDLLTSIDIMADRYSMTRSDYITTLLLQKDAPIILDIDYEPFIDLRITYDEYIRAFNKVLSKSGLSEDNRNELTEIVLNGRKELFGVIDEVQKKLNDAIGYIYEKIEKERKSLSKDNPNTKLTQLYDTEDLDLEETESLTFLYEDDDDGDNKDD